MNFRKGPSTTATIIGSVPEGAKVDVIESRNGWDLVTYNGVTGYIHGGNVADSYSAPAKKNTSENTVKNYFDYGFAQAANNLPESGDGCHTVKVSDGYLALRSAPTYDDSNVIGQLYTGDTVELISTYNTGSYVEVFAPKFGAYGYVNAAFIA